MLPNQSSLSIQLTEPVVHLRSTPRRAHREHNGAEMAPPAVVRGLLTLQLSEPTKISHIELTLQAKASTRCTRGAGPDRTEITEQYTVHSTSAVVFQAGASPVPQQQSAIPIKPRVQFVDDHATSEVQQASPTLDPQLGTDQVPMGPAPPYPLVSGQRLSLDTNLCPGAAGSPLSASSSSRSTESPISPIQPRTSPPPHRSSLSSAHSVPDFSHTSSIEELPEDDGESSDLCHEDVAYYGLARVAASSSSRSPEQGRRGRSHSRLALGKVAQIFDAMKDRLRSRSPRSKLRTPLDEQEERGRSLVKGKGKIQMTAQNVMQDGDPLVTNGTEDQCGDNWAVFPEGTYTYPISFTIPHSSPPTMKANHGSLIWKVKSEVELPSVFRWRMTTQKEVVIVSVPRDDDLEEVDGIDVQQQWDDQFHYRIQIAGCGFPVGGEVPFQLTIMPLAKIKVHCISVYLDERTAYYTRGESHARSDTIRRATLLFVKHKNADERYSEPILPLTSDDPEAFRKSPLYRLLRPGEDESEMTSSVMGPGPWTIRYPLKVPESCSMIHPSNHAKGSNVMVNHTLKTVLRVEKEGGTGKKLCDVVVHMPIQILSCRCTSTWAFLPQYEEAVGSETESTEDADIALCPCHAQHQAKAQTFSHAADTALTALMERASVTSRPLKSSIPTRASDTSPSDSFVRRIHLHEQLMSGLVSERGEVPPSYAGAVYE